MVRKSELAALIKKHRILDAKIESNRNQFLSDWNCDNPYFEKLLGSKLFSLASDRASSSSYIYFDEEHSILRAIRHLHLKGEKLQISDRNVLAGHGSSSFLAAFSLWLHRCGHATVYYMPPLYHTFHFLLESININAIPVAEKHAFEVGYSMNLPSQRAILLLCDPIWYAGKTIPLEQILIIADWQRATRSLVFVDGSFQYMQWNKNRSENTALLDPELTFRLVCPAKALAVPFFRFAYLLHPSDAHDDFVFLYESMIGGASASDLAFARRALEVLDSDTTSCVMPGFYQKIYSMLIERGLIETKIIPECGYFVFAVPKSKLVDQVVMDQTYFELKGYSGYCRINLMAARRIYSLELLGDERHEQL